MKIGNPADKAVTGVGAGTPTDGAAAAARGSGKTGSLEGGVESSAKVKLSSTAGSLLTGTDTSFDADKVNRVKKAIDEGTYKVNPEAIADKLIANAQELLGRKVS